jgi:hypothetical protein
MANPRPMHLTNMQRLLPGCAAFHPAPVTTHHTQAEPHRRPEQRRHDRVPHSGWQLNQLRGLLLTRSSSGLRLEDSLRQLIRLLLTPMMDR